MRCGLCVHASEPREEDGKVKCALGRLHYPEYTPWWDPDMYHNCVKYKRDWERLKLRPRLFYKGGE